MMISLIVPVYNVEPYIGKCIASIISQLSCKLGIDYEVIVVDDGSPDKSGEIADILLCDKLGCTVIHQENKGLSEARNVGLAAANGDYIWYVDSDDWIEPHAISELMRLIRENSEPDVIMIRSRIETNEGSQNIWHKKWSDEYSMKTGLQVLCKDNWLTPAQFFIVKRDFVLFNDLWFKPGILHEDNHYTPRLLYFAKSVIRTNKVLYHSYVNNSSITKTPNPKRSFDLLSTCKDLSEFADNHRFSKREEMAWNKFIAISLNSALFLMRNHPAEVQTKFNVKLSAYRSLFYRIRHSSSIRHIIEGIIFKYSQNYVLIYSLLTR